MYMRLMKMTTTIPESIEIILAIIELHLRKKVSIAILVVIEIILSTTVPPKKGCQSARSIPVEES